MRVIEWALNVLYSWSMKKRHIIDDELDEDMIIFGSHSAYEADYI